jgi:hypothetical protein
MHATGNPQQPKNTPTITATNTSLRLRRRGGELGSAMT